MLQQLRNSVRTAFRRSLDVNAHNGEAVPIQEDARHRDLSLSLSRATFTLLGYSLFCAIALSGPDANLLGATAELMMPFAGVPIAYGAFLGVGPAVLAALTGYVYLLLLVWAPLCARVPQDRRYPAPFNLSGPTAIAYRIVVWVGVPSATAYYFAWKALPRREGEWLAIYWAGTVVAIGLMAGVAWLRLRVAYRPTDFRPRHRVAQLASLAAFVAALGYAAPLALPVNRTLQLRGADLSGQDLRHLDLSGTDLSRANLEGASLARANLDRVDLTDANLRSADLREASLRGTLFRRTKLRQATLERTYVGAAKFVEAFVDRPSFQFAYSRVAVIDWGSGDDKSFEVPRLMDLSSETRAALARFSGPSYSFEVDGWGDHAVERRDGSLGASDWETVLAIVKRVSSEGLTVVVGLSCDQFPHLEHRDVHPNCHSWYSVPDWQPMTPSGEGEEGSFSAVKD